MAITYTKLIYHSVWEVRGRLPIIVPPFAAPIEMAITQEFLALNCHIHVLKSNIDHIHCLFEYSGDKGLSSIFKQVKGGSSYQLKSDGVVPEELYWEKGYDCYSVSPSNLNDVISFINDQVEYHKSISLTDELTMLRKRAGLIR